MKTAAATVGIVLGFVALVALIWSIAFGFSWLTAGPNGKLQARQQIQSGAFRIEAYDHFFNLCQSVQTDEAALQAQYQELNGATGDDKERIKANIAGITADRASAINEYNADSTKDYTVGQFKASKLPYRLDHAFYTKGVHTECTA